VRLFRDSLRSFLFRLKKYFSGRLFLVQFSAGVGAFALRTLAAVSLQEKGAWLSVAIGQVGSYTGYIGVYVLGYWLVFRKDYKLSGRSIKKDIFGLQVAEQLPNASTLLLSSAWQVILIETTGSTWAGVNLGSWFGPHKIVNVFAMFFSNSIKRGWVDGAWLAPMWVRRILSKIGRFSRAIDDSKESPDSIEIQLDQGEVVDGKSVAEN